MTHDDAPDANAPITDPDTPKGTTAATDPAAASPPAADADRPVADDADADAEDDTTPDDDTPQPREYLRIRPADRPIGAETVARHVRRLHSLDGDDQGLLTRLLPWRPQPPTIEVLLASTGGAEPRIDYYVGVDDPELLDALKHTVRTLVPTAYEITRAEYHPRWTLTSAPGTPPSTPPAADAPPSDTADRPQVAAVELVGDPELHTDWTTPLTRFEEIHDDDTPASQVPLATVVETMADTAVPMVYQCLLRPKPDWSETADDLDIAIRHGEHTLGGKIYNAVAMPIREETPTLEDCMPSDRQRVEGIRDRAKRWSFACTVRAVAVAPTADPGADMTRPAGVADGGAPGADTGPDTDTGMDTDADAGADDESTDRADEPRRFLDQKRRDRTSSFDRLASGGATTTTDTTSTTATSDTTATDTTTTTDRTTGTTTTTPSVGPGAATEAVADLNSAFAPVSGPTYAIDARVHRAGSKGAARVGEELCERTFHPPNYDSWRRRLPLTSNACRGIVASHRELPSFILVDGSALTAAGERAIAPTPGERTARPQPPGDRLAPYQTQGFSLGRPRTQDATTAPEPVAVPPALQPLHLGIFGPTGAGKSVLAARGLLDNHAATDGATVIVDPKGDGFATDYLRAHYERYGSLQDVYYFDCSEQLPAFSFFDVRDLVEAGVPRDTAVEKLTTHYMEILRQVVGPDRFESAIRSPDVIRYLVKALFDPANGTDAFSHRDLHGAVRRMHERESPPTVSQPDLERALNGIVANRARTFDEIMQGVANRIEKLLVDRRLARMFNHVPQDDDDPHFDFREFLDEDATIIFDLGGLQGDAQRVLTLVVLSQLWRALKRRQQATNPEADHPLVNLHVEEAASVAVSDLLNTLLSQGRAFDLSVSLSLQFPAQLKERAPDTYRELLANVGTFVVGPVPVDDQLAKRLATDDTPPSAVATRLRALERGDWLVSLPAAFGEPAPQPFQVQSLTPPPGHSASDTQLTEHQRDLADAAITRTKGITSAEIGLSLGTPGVASGDRTAGDDAAPTPVTDAPSAESAANADDDDGTASRVDSCLPHTNRLPDCVEYDPEMHGLRCRECDNRYDPTIDGLRRTINCCHDRDDVDRDDVPVCELNLKLTPDERAASDWTDHQLMFLQAVYNAQQRRYDPLEYDLTWDSMLRLREYVGIDGDAVQDLLDAGCLQHDTDLPHKLYTVTPEGRDVIGESYREGVDYGHGQGDLEESSEHVLGVQLAEQLLHEAYVTADDSTAAEVVPYYELDDTRRLDVAALDADGNVVVAVEVERINNDVQRAVPADFDKMASCDPNDAIWIVPSRKAGHAVLTALNDPPEGEPRVEKTYSENTPPQQFNIDTPGLTAVYPMRYVQTTVLDIE